MPQLCLKHLYELYKWHAAVFNAKCHLVNNCSCLVVPTNSLTHPPCFCVCMFGIIKGSAGDPALPSPHQHTLSSLHQGGEQYSSTTTRWQYSTSLSHSDSTEPRAVSPRGLAAQENTTSWSNQGHTESIRQMESDLRGSLSEDSDNSDTVFSEQLSVWSQRLSQRLNRTPLQRWASVGQPKMGDYRSLRPHSSFTDELRSWEGRGVWDEGY